MINENNGNRKTRIHTLTFSFSNGILQYSLVIIRLILESLNFWISRFLSRCSNRETFMLYYNIPTSRDQKSEICEEITCACVRVRCVRWRILNVVDFLNFAISPESVHDSLQFEKNFCFFFFLDFETLCERCTRVVHVNLIIASLC